MNHDLFGVDYAPRSGSECLVDGTVFCTVSHWKLSPTPHRSDIW